MEIAKEPRDNEQPHDLRGRRFADKPTVLKNRQSWCHWTLMVTGMA